jgi:fructan beta-fructosidase
MAVYSEHQRRQTIAFHTSKDLKEWEFASRLEGYYECPEIFELPVDGDREHTRWVVFAADARYALGEFDGKVFTPLHEGKHRLHYGSYYASQVFSNAPDDRRIQIGWAQIDMPGMPFNQTFSFPHELTLRTTGDGTRLFAEPVREIRKLYRRSHVIEAKRLRANEPFDVPVEGELFDIRASFAPGDAARVGLEVGGDRIVYDVAAGELQGARLAPIDGRVEIRVLVDRPMMETIGNRGRVYVTSARTSRGSVSAIRVFAAGGTARLLQLEAHELGSIWDRRPEE